MTVNRKYTPLNRIMVHPNEIVCKKIKKDKKNSSVQLVDGDVCTSAMCPTRSITPECWGTPLTESLHEGKIGRRGVSSTCPARNPPQVAMGQRPCGRHPSSSTPAAGAILVSYPDPHPPAILFGWKSGSGDYLQNPWRFFWIW